MNKPAKALLLLACLLPLHSCATVNLWRWGMDDSSVYSEPKGDVSAGMMKPLATLVGTPVTAVWDVVTFPFQAIFGVYPYGERFMNPEEVDNM